MTRPRPGSWLAWGQRCRTISHRPNTPPTASLVPPGFWLLAPGSLGLMSIAVGVQTGLLLWRAAIQLSATPHRRAVHD